MNEIKNIFENMMSSLSNVPKHGTDEYKLWAEKHDKYSEIAMQSPKHLEIALNAQKEWNKTHPHQYHISSFVKPWIADKKIKILRFVTRCSPDWGTWEGGCSKYPVYDVHGIEKMCTRWDINSMPLPRGVAYECVPE